MQNYFDQRQLVRKQYVQKRSYTKVSKQLKKALIQRVVIQEHKISESARQLNINLSAAKAIVLNFRKGEQQFLRSKYKSRLNRQKKLEQKSAEKSIQDNYNEENQVVHKQNEEEASNVGKLWNSSSEFEGFFSNCLQIHFLLTISFKFAFGIEQLF